METSRFVHMHRAYAYDRETGAYCLVLSVPAGLIEDPLWAELPTVGAFAMELLEVPSAAALADRLAGALEDAHGHRVEAFAQHVVFDDIVTFEDGGPRVTSLERLIGEAEGVVAGGLIPLEGDRPILFLAVPGGIVVIGTSRSVSPDDAAIAVSELRRLARTSNAYGRFGWMRLLPGVDPDEVDREVG